MPVWVEFAKHNSGCLNVPWRTVPEILTDPTKPLGNGNYVDPKKADAWLRARAKELTGEEPTKVSSLPYGSGPALDPNDDRGGWFCYSPESCKGRSSCPKSYACSE